MKKFTLLLMGLFSTVTFSQKILHEYPSGQNAYRGGQSQMFAEMQDYFLKSGAQPCAKPEIYFVTLKINEAGRPFLIKSKDKDAASEKNRCAYELAVKSLGSLKNWQPAEKKR